MFPFLVFQACLTLFAQGSKFALRIRFIAKNCESEANSLRFASLRFAENFRVNASLSLRNNYD